MTSLSISKLAAISALGAATFALLALSASLPVAADPGTTPAVARGEYLVGIMGCNDCHTPMKMGPSGPAPDMSRMLSGHPEEVALPSPPPAEGPWIWVGAATNTAFGGPWGVSFASNLTPDPETGLGRWTEKTFIDAIRSARHEGQGRPILPPMPVQAYQRATDDDLRAIFAYLHSLPPMHNRVPQPVDPAESR